MGADAKIAARLKEARKASGYESAAEAADAMDLTYGTYAGHENGNRGVPLKALSRYAVFFRVNLTWLAEGRGKMRGKEIDTPDVLDGLSPANRERVIEYIELLRLKQDN